ncbi:MAG TPA: hypothetical protein VMR97_07840 [Acidimicrobiales bacterium]|nr:hypothetical protein [Acidimicrobiales bacterium]
MSLNYTCDVCGKNFSEVCVIDARIYDLEGNYRQLFRFDACSDKCVLEGFTRALRSEWEQADVAPRKSPSKKGVGVQSPTLAPYRGRGKKK